ncbi:uncharacterized protein EV154DRAFT_450858 [Mucor mucedo]|uniref:uncharacterized protein n=1 Tax=Mucor mucedo TaxID=29922 RepID=UPI00221E849F|nr:uncharacterized protein EV154DRAFT_450858 [Mucor mucedo]KAI7879844.1 hypothetical protein EV154DRAFT_450858 [Mucor mucedo]
MPTEQSNGIPAAHRRALIPPSQMEFHNQRLYAISIFVLLQAWKLADLLLVHSATYPEQHQGTLLKWCLIDATYFVALHVAKIPWLQFPFWKTCFFMVLFPLLNSFFFAGSSAGLTALFMNGLYNNSLGKLTSVSKGKPINADAVVYNTSHIMGQHTVRLLPYGTAKLNPHDETYCLPSAEFGEKEIHIPIVLNNTIPHTISLSHYELETKTTSVEKYSGSDIQRVTEIGNPHPGLEYYLIRIRKTGVYKLKNIISQDGVDVRLYNRQVFVFTCPYAHFKPLDSVNYCTGDQKTLDIQVMGVPPLKIEYKKRFNHGSQETVWKLNRIQPDGFDSPLQHIDSVDTAFLNANNADENYDWAAVHHMNVPINLTLDTASDGEYKLARVIDGAGNVLDLSDESSQRFVVHGRPTAKFHCSPTYPVNLLIGQTSTQLPLILQGTGPFHLEYNHNSDESHLRRAKLNAGEKSISVNQPGEYNLKSVRDQFCEGKVLFPAACQVVQPELPSVKVNATAIPSTCAGDTEVGMKFIAEFVGTPPYVIEYLITKKEGRHKSIVERKRETIDRSRHIFSYMPNASGEYTYEFTSLDDLHYKKRPTHVPSINQFVHPQPDAKFSSMGRSTVRTCLGEDISVDVDLRGTAPFVLFWTFKNEVYSDQVEGNKYTIKLPPFEQAGNHIVSLVKIQDSNDCLKDLESRDFTINVRRDRPTAFFNTGGEAVRNVQMTEGSTTRLPIGLTGEGPWSVTYRNVEAGDKSIKTERFNDPNASIQVRSTGHYELISVEDAICKGDVFQPQYLVELLDKPTISVDKEEVIELAPGVYERPAVCQGVSDGLGIELRGLGPFFFSYKESHSASGHRDFRLLGHEEITSSNGRMRLPLKTREAGKYRYVIDQLSDQRYTTPIKIKDLQIEQRVHATPTVQFTKDSRKERSVCVGDALDSEDMKPLLLEFTGVAPFSVELGIRLQTETSGHIIKLHDIMTKKYKLSVHEELVKSGIYSVNILSVNDANNCGTKVIYSDETSVTIKALDNPKITPSELCSDVCVGDSIDFGLHGVGPFTVKYVFNDKITTMTSKTPKLSLFADKPGNITILSVGDQRNQCRSFPKEMTRIIHEVPSSFVSGGKEIIENIHEGDMVQAVVDLVGTPPFNFEWRRRRLIWDTANKRHYKGEVLERHTVYNVAEHRYFINTSVEGIIEIVSVKDKYCQYPI